MLKAKEVICSIFIGVSFLSSPVIIKVKDKGEWISQSTPWYFIVAAAIKY